MANYKTVKAVYDASELLRENNHLDYVQKFNDRTYQVDSVRYSPQEILIKRTWQDSSFDASVSRSYPDGVSRCLYSGSPRKEYIYFKDGEGVTRYYWIPEDGLRLHPKGGSYVVVDPPKDFSITVSRSLAKEARTEYQDYIDYINAMWHMVYYSSWLSMSMPAGHYGHYPVTTDKQHWMYNVLKLRHGQGYTKDTAISIIYNDITQKHLAYDITEVPDTRMDITSHWDMYGDLKKAGRLKRFGVK